MHVRTKDFKIKKKNKGIKSLKKKGGGLFLHKDSVICSFQT